MEICVMSIDQERLRDEFAKIALPACYESAIKTLENEGFPEENWRVGVALDAYQMADAMLIARNIERGLRMNDRELLEMEVVWPIPAGTAAFMPGTIGFTMVCFTAEQVPSNTKVYTEHQVREMLAQRG